MATMKKVKEKNRSKNKFSACQKRILTCKLPKIFTAGKNETSKHFNLLYQNDHRYYSYYLEGGKIYRNT